MRRTNASKALQAWSRSQETRMHLDHASRTDVILGSDKLVTCSPELELIS
jgi:hypothetical protein